MSRGGLGTLRQAQCIAGDWGIGTGDWGLIPFYRNSHTYRSQ
ncbi:MAG: hypothetical protein ACSI46_11450 [Gloeotrichia echinulata DVL01]